MKKCPTDVIKYREIFPEFEDSVLDFLQMDFVFRKKLHCSTPNNYSLLSSVYILLFPFFCSYRNS